MQSHISPPRAPQVMVRGGEHPPCPLLTSLGSGQRGGSRAAASSTRKHKNEDFCQGERDVLWKDSGWWCSYGGHRVSTQTWVLQQCRNTGGGQLFTSGAWGRVWPSRGALCQPVLALGKGESDLQRVPPRSHQGCEATTGFVPQTKRIHVRQWERHQDGSAARPCQTPTAALLGNERSKTSLSPPPYLLSSCLKKKKPNLPWAAWPAFQSDLGDPQLPMEPLPAPAPQGCRAPTCKQRLGGNPGTSSSPGAPSGDTPRQGWHRSASPCPCTGHPSTSPPPFAKLCANANCLFSCSSRFTPSLFYFILFFYPPLSFLSSSWVKNNQVSGKQQLLLRLPPRTRPGE